MMMFADALISLATLIAFACLFYGPWQAACTDTARQFIFERRDALFDIARSGQLDFASSEYKIVRRSMEGMIRYAHELTWINLWFLSRVEAKVTADALPITRAIESISDPSTRDKVKGLVNESIFSLMAMMAAKSIFLMPFIAVVMMYSYGAYGFSALVRRMQTKVLVKLLAETILSGSECTPT
jgi:hypothetical protein